MLTSAASVTSITSLLAIGVTAGSIILSVVLILSFATREIGLSLPSVDSRLIDSINAILVPLVLSFLVIFTLEILSVIN